MQRRSVSRSAAATLIGLEYMYKPKYAVGCSIA
jgi:hypothetical protein